MIHANNTKRMRGRGSSWALDNKLIFCLAHTKIRPPARMMSHVSAPRSPKSKTNIMFYNEFGAGVVPVVGNVSVSMEQLDCTGDTVQFHSMHQPVSYCMSH